MKAKKASFKIQRGFFDGTRGGSKITKPLKTLINQHSSLNRLIISILSKISI